MIPLVPEHHQKRGAVVRGIQPGPGCLAQDSPGNMPALKYEKERKLKEKKLKNEEGHVTTGKKMPCSVGMKGSQSGQYVQERESVLKIGLESCGGHYLVRSQRLGSLWNMPCDKKEEG